MTPLDALLAAIADLQRDDLERWVRDELVTPEVTETGDWVFAEPACARIRLICALHYDLEIGAETLPVVLSLLDQLYDTRADLVALSRAVAAQDAELRHRVLSTLKVLRHA